MADMNSVIDWMKGLCEDDWPDYYSNSEVQNAAKAGLVLCETALQALEDMESTVPCDIMAGEDDWCEEHCKPGYGSAMKECWARFLMGFNNAKEHL